MDFSDFQAKEPETGITVSLGVLFVSVYSALQAVKVGRDGTLDAGAVDVPIVVGNQLDYSLSFRDVEYLKDCLEHVLDGKTGKELEELTKSVFDIGTKEEKEERLRLAQKDLFGV